MSAENRRWVLSGGLASGKSKVRELLERRGVHTIDGDSVGHTVLEPDGLAYAEAVQRWPQVVRDGRIHRPSLASIVFSDTSELDALEKMTHPHIFDMIRARAEEVESTVVVEIPVLSHSLGDEWRRIVVDSRDEVRLRRAVERGMSEHDALLRIASQPPRSVWLAAAEAVIPNHQRLDQLEETVHKLAAAIAI